MADRIDNFTKVLSAGDVNDRLSVPAKWRDQLLPEVADNGKARVRVLDEKGDRYDFFLKVRKNKIKPEFMARGWKRFVQKRKLFAGDILFFSRNHESPGSFSVRVLEVGPTLQLGLVPLAAADPQPPPAAEARDLGRPISGSGYVQEDPPTLHHQEQSHGGAFIRLFGQVCGHDRV